MKGLLASLSFNPRARDGRENSVKMEESTGLVSIHAPVMDANYWL